MEIIAAFFVLSGILISLLIFIDTRRHRLKMKIMEAVWPLTGLWANWFAFWAYRLFGRSPMSMSSSMNDHMSMPARPHWQGTTLSTLHCGAGCTLADLIGEWFTFYVPISIGGSMLAGQWILDFILALLLGIYFQYAAIRGMEKISPAKALSRAVKADFFSLTAWQIGMYGWMAIVIFAIRQGTPLSKTTWTFWFMMQIAMGVGFLCSYPVNRLLIHTGIKHEM